MNFYEVYSTASSTSLSTGTWTRPPATGDLLVCWFEYNDVVNSNVSVTGVTDTKGNLYRRAAPRFANPALFSGDYGEELWYATNVSGGAGFNLTATFSTNNSSIKQISCHEYKGLKPLALQDQTSTAQGNGSTITSGTMNVSAAPSLVIIAGGMESASGVYASSGFTKRSDQGGSFYIDGVRDVAGSYQATALVRPAGGYQAVVLTFVSR